MNKVKLAVKNNPWIILAIILIFSILLRLYNLNRSLWYDEVWYSTHITLGDAGQLINLSLHDKAAPFYRIFMFFWIRLFGDSELSVRTPPFLSGILSIFLTYLIAMKSAGRKAAVLASFLLCLSAVHIWYSQEATHYSMLLFLILVSIFSLNKLKGGAKNAAWYFIYFPSLFLAVFTHWFASAYLISTSIVSLSSTGKVRRNILELNLAILIFLAAAILLKAHFGHLPLGDYFLRPFTFFELWMLFFNWFTFGNTLWPVNPYHNRISVILLNPGMLATQIFFFLIFFKGLASSALKEKNPYASDNFLYLFTLPLAILVLSYIGFRHLYIERYLFVLLPFFYIFLSKGALSLKNKSLRIASAAAIVVFSIAALCGLLVKADTWTVYKHNPDWKSAIRYFIDEQKGGKQPLFIFATAPARSLIYYADKSPSEEEPLRFQLYEGGENTFYDVIGENKTGVFYLIENKTWNENFPELLKSVMKNTEFRLISTRSFRRLAVYKFSVK